MRIFFAILLSIGIFAAGFFWQKSHHEVVELSLDISFRALQRMAYDELQFTVSKAHLAEVVRAELTLDGRRTPVLLEALPQIDKTKFSAIKVSIDEKEDFEPRHMLLINSAALKQTPLSASLHPYQIQEAPLYVNGKRVAHYSLMTEPFYKMVSYGYGPIARRMNGVVELSFQSKQLPIMNDILTREAHNLPSTKDNSWWYWNKKEWVLLGSWPEGWPL